MSAFSRQFGSSEGAANGFFVNVLRQLRGEGAEVTERILCRATCEHLKQRIADGMDTGLHGRVLEAAKRDPEATMEHAREVIAREATRGADGGGWRDGPAGQRPPTPSQLSFLQKLGYRGPAPASIGKASDLIGSLKDGEGRR